MLVIVIQWDKQLPNAFGGQGKALVARKKGIETFYFTCTLAYAMHLNVSDINQGHRIQPLKAVVSASNSFYN